MSIEIRKKKKKGKQANKFYLKFLTQMDGKVFASKSVFEKFSFP